MSYSIERGKFNSEVEVSLFNDGKHVKTFLHSNKKKSLKTDFLFDAVVEDNCEVFKFFCYKEIISVLGFEVLEVKREDAMEVGIDFIRNDFYLKNFKEDKEIIHEFLATKMVFSDFIKKCLLSLPDDKREKAESISDFFSKHDIKNYRYSEKERRKRSWLFATRIFNKDSTGHNDLERKVARNMLSWMCKLKKIENEPFYNYFLGRVDELFHQLRNYVILETINNSSLFEYFKAFADGNMKNVMQVLGLKNKKEFELVKRASEYRCSVYTIKTAMNNSFEKIDKNDYSKREKILEVIKYTFEKTFEYHGYGAFRGYNLVSSVEDIVGLHLDGYDNYKKLIDYIVCDCHDYQGINSSKEAIQFLKDYINMMKEMGLNYEKYPSSLKRSHDLAMMNYRLMSNEIEKKKFKESCDGYRNLEWNTKKESEYAILVPESVEELKEEGERLSHCVGSYVSRINSGNQKVVFLRRKDKLEEPYVTVSVDSNNRISQVKEKFNGRPNKSVMDFVKRWAEEKKLVY